MSFSQFQYQDMLARQDDLYAGAKYKIIVDYLKNKKNLKILNAGCGSGELSFLLASAGHHVVGIDPSEEYIDLAKKNLSSNIANSCNFIVSSIENFSDSERYDCIVATDVLEHIKDDVSAVKKLGSMLKIGGYLVITVPAMPALFGYHDEQLEHYRRYTKNSLRAILENYSSLTIKKLRYFGFTLIPVCFLYSKIWRKPYPISTNKKSFFSLLKTLLLKLILFIDSFCPFPVGTSLICITEKEAEDNVDS